MEPQTQNQNLKSLSIKERHQVKVQFFRLYEKSGNLAKSARDLGISLRTATTWKRDYKANGNKVAGERLRGRRYGSFRTLTSQQER